MCMILFLTMLNNISQTTQLFKQLIAIDYYLQHKVKPKILYREEYEMSDKISLIDKYKLNHHKYRFVIIPIRL
jgi:hypothetical protein